MTLRGKIVGVDAAELARLTVEIDSQAEDGTRVVRPARSGHFSTAGVPERAPATIVVRTARTAAALASVTVQEPGNDEIVIHLGHVATRAAEIAEVGERLKERDAVEENRRSLLRSEVTRQREERTEARTAARLVIDGIAAHAAGSTDVLWLAQGDDTVTSVVQRAASSALEDRNLDVVSVRASTERVQVDDVVDAAALAEIVTGQSVGTQGLVRQDLGSRARTRAEHVDSTGLPAAPVPASTQVAPPPAGQRSDTTPDDRLAALVGAIRLPEEPPLVTASAAVGPDGIPRALHDGPAQEPALHDFHELRIAMADVWHLRIDKTVTDAVEQVTGELTAAGINLAELRDAAPAARMSTLVDIAGAYETAVQGTPVGAVALKRRPFDAAMDNPLGGGFYVRPDPVDPDDDDDDDDDDHVSPTGSTPRSLLDELRSFMAGGHPFTVFAADGNDRAVNFGLLVTWRQRWDPVAYQTGDVVGTITLTPGETRKVVTRTRRHSKRHTEETDRSQRHRRAESADTARAETEILRKAEATTNFQLSASGTTNLLVTDGTFTTAGSRSKGDEGSDMRKRFREAVRKAAQEYRDEHSTEVTRDDELSSETETTAEIRNPNDELAMTAVFYELARRYRICERLHRARAVVMVAMPVPDPADITIAWLIRHDWIIRRSLLDDSFLPALEHLASSFLGQEKALARLRQSETTHRAVVERTGQVVASYRAAAQQRAAYLDELRKNLAGEGKDSSILDVVPGIKLANDAVSWLDDMFSDDDEQEQRHHEQLLAAAEQALARADREAADAATRLDAATTAYQEVAHELAAAESRAANQAVGIERLRVHVRDNLLHYMQAVWAHQPPDQRYFELHGVQVPVVDGQVTVESAVPEAGVPGITSTQFAAQFTRDGGPPATKPLASVADLDDLLGFKGNYAIFPMRAQNALTSLLLAPLLDGDEILADPTDPAANWTLTDLREHAAHLRAQVAAGNLDPDEFEAVHVPWLRATLEALIADPNPSEEEIVVPSGSAYMELLPSGQSLLEPFTLEHRALDVANVRAQIRQLEIDNLRRAARIGSDMLDDPEMDEFERRLVVRNGDNP